MMLKNYTYKLSLVTNELRLLFVTEGLSMDGRPKTSTLDAIRYVPPSACSK
jgi:hypothetical protein